MERKTVLVAVAVVIALLGAGLVFVYVQGVKGQAADSQAGRRVLVATAAIDAGETIDDAQAAGKIDLEEVPPQQLVDGAMTSTQGISGQIALTTVLPNEQIVASKFGEPGEQQDLTIPNKKMAISVQLTDPARVAGFVVPGSHVAVFASRTSTDAAGTSSGDYTRLLLPDAEVIGVGQTSLLSTTTTAGDGQTTEEVPQTILTLALSLPDAQKVIYASRPPGELAFGLLTDKSDVGRSDGVNSSNLFAGSVR